MRWDFRRSAARRAGSSVASSGRGDGSGDDTDAPASPDRSPMLFERTAEPPRGWSDHRGVVAPDRRSWREWRGACAPTAAGDASYWLGAYGVEWELHLDDDSAGSIWSTEIGPFFVYASTSSNTSPRLCVHWVVRSIRKLRASSFWSSNSLSFFFSSCDDASFSFPSSINCLSCTVESLGPIHEPRRRRFSITRSCAFAKTSTGWRERKAGTKRRTVVLSSFLMLIRWVKWSFFRILLISPACVWMGAQLWDRA